MKNNFSVFEIVTMTTITLNNNLESFETLYTNIPRLDKKEPEYDYYFPTLERYTFKDRFAKTKKKDDERYADEAKR
ncbi:unnamed protein product, partial [marine sediment metagenome]